MVFAHSHSNEDDDGRMISSHYISTNSLHCQYLRLPIDTAMEGCLVSMRCCSCHTFAFTHAHTLTIIPSIYRLFPASQLALSRSHWPATVAVQSMDKARSSSLMSGQAVSYTQAHGGPWPGYPPYSIYAAITVTVSVVVLLLFHQSLLLLQRVSHDLADFSLDRAEI